MGGRPANVNITDCANYCAWCHTDHAIDEHNHFKEGDIVPRREVNGRSNHVDLKTSDPEDMDAYVWAHCYINGERYVSPNLSPVAPGDTVTVFGRLRVYYVNPEAPNVFFLRRDSVSDYLDVYEKLQNKRWPHITLEQFGSLITDTHRVLSEFLGKGYFSLKSSRRAPAFEKGLKAYYITGCIPQPQVTMNESYKSWVAKREKSTTQYSVVTQYLCRFEAGYHPKMLKSTLYHDFKLAAKVTRSRRYAEGHMFSGMSESFTNVVSEGIKGVDQSVYDDVVSRLISTIKKQMTDQCNKMPMTLITNILKGLIVLFASAAALYIIRWFCSSSIALVKFATKMIFPNASETVMASYTPSDPAKEADAHLSMNDIAPILSKFTCMFAYGITARPVNVKQVTETLRGVAQASTFLEALMKNLEPIVRCVVAHITGDPSWTRPQMDDDIQHYLSETERMRATPDLEMRAKNDEIIQDDIRKLYAFLSDNGPSLRDVGFRMRDHAEILDRARRDITKWYKIVIDAQSNRGNRRTPVCMVFSGPPAQGKGEVMDNVIKILFAYARLKGTHSADIGSTFSKSPDTLYWDTYNGQFAYLVDEWLASGLNEVKSMQLSEFTSVVSNGAYPLNYANCEAKGNSVFRSPLCVYGTNFTTMDRVNCTSPAAIYKRMHFPMEVSRGKTVEQVSDIRSGWMLTITEHALKNQKLYIGTPQALWDACTSGSDRAWISFGRFLDIALEFYKLTQEGPILSDIMGNPCDYLCNHVLKEGKEFGVSMSDKVEAEVLVVNKADEIELIELDGDSDSDDDGKGKDPGSDVPPADAHMLNYFGWGMELVEPEADDLDARVDATTFSSMLKELCEQPVFENIEERSMIFFDYLESALTKRFFSLELDASDSDDDDLVFTTHNRTVQSMIDDDFKQQIMLWTYFAYAVGFATKFFPNNHTPELSEVAHSLNVQPLIDIYPEYYVMLLASQSLSYGKDWVSMDRIKLKVMQSLLAEITPADDTTILCSVPWNHTFYAGAIRRTLCRSHRDCCNLVSLDTHVCSGFLGSSYPKYQRVYMRAYDICQTVKVFFTGVRSMMGNVGEFLRAPVLSTTSLIIGAFEVDQAYHTALYLSLSFLGSIVASALIVTVVSKSVGAIMALTSNSDGHSEIHKNPVFMRPGKTDQMKQAYVAEGHVAATMSLKSTAIASAHRYRGYLSLILKNGDTVQAKCLRVGVYIFLHSHIFWAFPDPVSVRIHASSPRTSIEGSVEYKWSELGFHDFMLDTNRRDLVRLTMPGKQAIMGKQPSTILVPREKWNKTVREGPLIRVLLQSNTREHSLAHEVKESYSIGRPYGTRIAMPGATPIVKEHDLGFMAYDTPSVHGDCSDPYMVGNHVIGLQVAYTGSDSVFMPIYLEDCDDQNSGMGHFSYFPPVVATNLNMPEGVNPIGMLDKHYTGVAKNNYASTIYNERGEEGVPGYLPKSFPSKRVPSALEGVDGKSPWTKHNSDYTRTTSPSMPDFMKFLMEDHPLRLVKDFYNVPSDQMARKLTEFEVDNGVEGFIVKMDLSKSNGLLGKVHGKSREQLYIIDEDNNYYPGSELRAAAEEIEQMIKSKAVPPLVCTEVLKSELKEKGKYPRCFLACGPEHIRWTKKVIGFALGLMKKHVAGSTCCVGINPHSHDWNLLYQSLISPAGTDTLFVGGDLTNCDLSCHPCFIPFMIEFFNQFYRYPKGTFDHDELVACCRSICYQIRVRGSRYFEIYRGHPSGHYLTTLFNSLVNFCVHRYVYMTNVDEKLYPWVENVSLKVYGDDSLAGVHPRVSKWFNMRTIQLGFAEFGMLYTDPDKQAVVPLFLEREKISFLGRGIVNTPTVCLAPLNKEAIYGMMLYVRVEDRRVDEALDDNIRCALMEMYHHGRDEFEKFKIKLYLDGKERGYISSSISNFSYEFFASWHRTNYVKTSDICEYLHEDFLTDFFFE